VSEEEKISLIRFGNMESKVNDMHAWFVAGKGCPLGRDNTLNIRWIWACVVSLALAVGAGFMFLYNGGGK